MAASVWTGADAVVYLVYRTSTSPLPTSVGFSTGTSATVTYRALTLSTLAGTSWVAATSMHVSATDLGGPVTGLTNRVFLDSTLSVAGFDTAAGQTSNWPLTTDTVSASAKWGSGIWEIRGMGSGIYVASAATMGDTLDYPVGTQINDLVIGHAWNVDNSTTPSNPTGWTGLQSNSSAGDNLGQTKAYIFSPVAVSGFVPQIWHM